MTRKRGGITHWHITLPGPLAARVDLRLLDPLRGRVKYGSRSGLIEKLLTIWLRAQEENAEVVISETGDQNDTFDVSATNADGDRDER